MPPEMATLQRFRVFGARASLFPSLGKKLVNPLSIFAVVSRALRPGCQQFDAKAHVTHRLVASTLRRQWSQLRSTLQWFNTSPFPIDPNLRIEAHLTHQLTRSRSLGFSFFHSPPGDPMKRFRLPSLTLATTVAMCFANTPSSAQTMTPRPSGGGLQPAPAASSPSLKRADLTADSNGSQFGFLIRNVGTGDAASTVTYITCTAYVAATPTKAGGGYVPCVQGTHYVLTPTIPPPGTVSSGDAWKVPTPALAATSGQFVFTLNIKTTPAQRPRGLNFKVCADANGAVNELNEGNNCAAFNYSWPN
jgi:hypothetical protein